MARSSLAGPTTLLATLSSLQMGFHAGAGKALGRGLGGAGRGEDRVQKFGDVGAKTKKKLEASTIESAEVRTRVMERQLRA